MNILGISAFYHDSAAALIRDGEIIAAAQEERFTRKKHDHAFPKNAVRYCLREAKIQAEDLDLVAFYDKPFIKFERILKSYIAYAPAGISSFIMAIPLWLKQKLLMSDTIKKELDYEGKVIFPEHHESHAASAFYASPFQEAAFITFDGVGEFTTSSYGIGRNNDLEILAEIHFPHSIGLLYSAFTYFLGFKVNSGEYKVMGLAPYGQPKYVDLIKQHLIDIKDDGSFRMNMEYFNYIAGLTMTNSKFETLFGIPTRQQESDLEPIHMDIARSLQAVTEEVMLKTANHVQQETGMKHLCLAGGVALNCVGNGLLLRESKYEDIWIQPASGDAGGALGAALFTWHKYLGNERKANGKKDFQKASYLGPAFSPESIESFLKDRNAPYTVIPTAQIPERVADLIADEKVIGWFQGRMEFGPRALGARSIIGDARSPHMQKTMNLKIKYRESFRPFAPSVMREHMADYFEMDHDSPYMLLVADVVKARRRELSDQEKSYFGLDLLNVSRSDIPAITHVDYSARIQSVAREDNPLYHAMIEAFRAKTGCAVIINTSFNVRGEPIVCSPKDAYTCFMRTEMDYLIMENYLLEKKAQPAWQEDKDWREEFGLD